MLMHYFKLFYKSLFKHKMFSAINIIGLSIGLTSIFIISSYLIYELSYDKFYNNSKRTFRIIGEEVKTGQSYVNTPFILGEKIKNDFHEVEAVVRIFYIDFTPKYDGKYMDSEKLDFCDPQIVKLFDIKFLISHSMHPLSAPNSLIISNKMSQKYFGNSNPIGKTIDIGKYQYYQITGVFQDFPQNTHIKLDFITSMDNFSRYFGKKNTEFFNTRWDADAFNTYILLSQHSNINNVIYKLPTLIEQYTGKSWLNEKKYNFQNLEDIHLHSSSLTFKEQNSTDIKTIYGLIWIIFIIMGIVSSNFLIISISKLSTKITDVGIRKVFGAGNSEIIMQYLLETFLFIFISLLISIILIIITYPYIKEYIIISSHFILRSIFYYVVIIFTYFLVLGVVSITCISLIIKKIAPNTLIKKTYIGGKKSTLFKDIIIILQLSICIFLFIFTLVIYKQLSFLKSTDLGFDKDMLFAVNTNQNSILHNYTEIKNKLLTNPNIACVSLASGVPPEETKYTGVEGIGEHANRKFKTKFFCGDYDFRKVLNLRLINGRFFDQKYGNDNNSIIVNEEFVKSMGWKDPIEKEVNLYLNARKYHVIGVIKDFNTRSLHEKIEPTLILLNYNDFVHKIIIKFSNLNNYENLTYIKNTWGKIFPDLLFSYSFISDDFNNLYQDERGQGKLLVISSIVSIFLVLFGLFGVSSFNIGTKYKEMGIRKVVGATTIELLFLQSKYYLKVVVISGLLCLPLSIDLTNRWLNKFTYRISLSIDEIIFSFTVMFMIIFVTVIYHIIKAASINPILVIKSE